MATDRYHDPTEYLVATAATESATIGITLNYNETEMTGTIARQPIADANMHMVRVICEIGISFPIAVLGIIGNLTAFVVLCQTKQRLTTNVLLQALAIADTLVLISSILLRSMRYVGWDAFDNVHHYIFVALYPCVYFLRLADTWLTVMMTIDRYIAVCRPLQAQRVCTLKRTYITIVVIVLTTFVFSLPRFFEYRLTQGPDVRHGFIMTELIMSPIYTLVYRIILFFLVMYLIPMALLIVLNIRLMCTLREAYANRSSMISNGSIHNGGGKMATKSSSQKVSRSITVIVGSVVTVCVVCNVTAMTAHVIWSLQSCFLSLRYLEYYRRYLANISNIMVTFNCAINFVIYCMFSRKFRKGLRETCHCDCACVSRRGWRSDSHNDSSGGGSTSYTSLGLLPMRVFKSHKHTVQHKSSADL